MYDPLIVDTFVNAYHDITPAARKAGQEARTIFPAEQHCTTEDITRPLRQIRANATESRLLSECIETVRGSRALTDVVNVSAHCLRQLTSARVFVLYAYSADTDALVCHGAAGDADRLLEGFTIKAGQRITGWCAATKRISVNSDAVLDLAQIAEAYNPPLRSALAVPLVHDHNLVGVLTSYSVRESAFNEAHSEIAEHVAVAVAERVVALRAASAGSRIVFPLSRA